MSPTKRGLAQIDAEVGSSIGAKGGVSQRDRRWTETVYDQHSSNRFPNGRPWWGECEQPAEQVGVARPVPGFLSILNPGDHNDPFGSSWEAPWYPEQVIAAQPGNHVSFFRIDMRRLRLTWNYQAMATYDRNATDAYFVAAAKIAHQRGLGTVDHRSGILPWEVQAVLGDPPRSPKIAEAAMAGDPWLLGSSLDVNPELARLLKGMPVSSPLVKPEAVMGMDAGALAAMIDNAVQKALDSEREAARQRSIENGRKGAEARKANQMAGA